MYKQILVASDASDGALAAVGKAAELACQFHAELIILHTYEMPPFYAAAMINPLESVGPDILNNWMAGANHTIRERTVAVAKRANVPYRYVEVRGHAARTIVSVAQEQNCDLIVVGSRGLSGVSALLGSVSERVGHLAHCSVLIVR